MVTGEILWRGGWIPAFFLCSSKDFLEKWFLKYSLMRFFCICPFHPWNHQCFFPGVGVSIRGHNSSWDMLLATLAARICRDERGCSSRSNQSVSPTAGIPFLNWSLGQMTPQVRTTQWNILTHTHTNATSWYPLLTDTVWSQRAQKQQFS